MRIRDLILALEQLEKDTANATLQKYEISFSLDGKELTEKRVNIPVLPLTDYFPNVASLEVETDGIYTYRVLVRGSF